MALPRKLTTSVATVALLLSACSDAESTNPSQDATSPTNGSVGDSVQAEAVIDGKIFAEVNGERRVWYVTHIERQGDWQSGSFWRPMMRSNAQISIFGLTEKGARPTGKGDIQLSFMVAGVGDISRPSETTINLFADGFSKTWSSDQGGSAQLVLNRVERDGEYIDLGGGFSGEVVLPDLGNTATQTDQPRTFIIKDGTFVAKLREFQRPAKERK